MICPRQWMLRAMLLKWHWPIKCKPLCCSVKEMTKVRYSTVECTSVKWNRTLHYYYNKPQSGHEYCYYEYNSFYGQEATLSAGCLTRISASGAHNKIWGSNNIHGIVHGNGCTSVHWTKHPLVSAGPAVNTLNLYVLSYAPPHRESARIKYVMILYGTSCRLSAKI